jgi:hypothetical protein
MESTNVPHCLDSGMVGGNCLSSISFAAATAHDEGVAKESLVEEGKVNLCKIA